MTRSACAIVAVFVGACDPWSEIGAAPTTHEDPALGTEIAMGQALRNEHFSIAYQPDALYLAIADAAGSDNQLVDRPAEIHVYAIDPTTLVARELPRLAVTGDATVIATAMPGCAVVSVDGTAIWDGTAWTQLPPLDVGASQTVVYDATHVVKVSEDRAHVYTWSGGAWTEGPAMAGPVFAGPVDATRVRLATWDGQSTVVTNTYAWPSLAPLGTDVTLTAPTPINAVVVTPNGTPDAFTAGYGHGDHAMQVLVFGGGTWQLGDDAYLADIGPPFAGDQLALISTPDPLTPGGLITSASFLAGGHAGDLALAGGFARVACTDPAAADCIAHDLRVLVVPDRSVTHAAYVSLSALSGDYRYYVRAVDLPVVTVFP